MLSPEIQNALKKDKTIDIITTGAKSGQKKTHEIWFHNLDGRIIICGTPDGEGKGGPRKRRDWLANLTANPDFTFVLKESVSAQIEARAVIIKDSAERRKIMSAPQTSWYREQTNLEDLVANSPIVEVILAA